MFSTGKGAANAANEADKPSNSNFDSDDYSELSSTLDAELSWIEWFCKLKENIFFVVVDEDYIRDDFNLTGLNLLVPHFRKALDIVLDSEEEEDEVSDDDLNSEERGTDTDYEAAAAKLYGLTHARYLLTTYGMQSMHDKLQSKVYGSCPNFYCYHQAVLPIGLSDHPNVSGTRVFCPRCREVYNPVSRRLATIDGAYFGSTFAGLWLLQSPLYNNKKLEWYVPKVYGFRVSNKIRDQLRQAKKKEISNNASSSKATGRKDGAISENRVRVLL